MHKPYLVPASGARAQSTVASRKDPMAPTKLCRGFRPKESLLRGRLAEKGWQGCTWGPGHAAMRPFPPANPEPKSGEEEEDHCGRLCHCLLT